MAFVKWVLWGVVAFLAVAQTILVAAGDPPGHLFDVIGELALSPLFWLALGAAIYVTRRGRGTDRPSGNDPPFQAPEADLPFPPEIALPSPAESPPPLPLPAEEPQPSRGPTRTDVWLFVPALVAVVLVLMLTTFGPAGSDTGDDRGSGAPVPETTETTSPKRQSSTTTSSVAPELALSPDDTYRQCLVDGTDTEGLWYFVFFWGDSGVPYLIIDQNESGTLDPEERDLIVEVPEQVYLQCYEEAFGEPWPSQ